MIKVNVEFVLLLLHLIQVINCLDWHFQGPNVALNKNATQFPGTYRELFPANLAVDGKTGTILARNRKYLCAHTDSKEVNRGANWTVDLDGSFIIKGIRIYNRKDNDNFRNGDYYRRLQYFKVSGTGSTDGAPEVLHDDMTSQTKVYLNTVININVTSKTPFNRIMVSIPARQDYRSYLTLCEVEVYAVLCNFPTISKPLLPELIPGTGSVLYTSAMANDRYVTPGTQIRFLCKTGSHTTLLGPSKLTCQDDEQYNFKTPKCVNREVSSEAEAKTENNDKTTFFGAGTGAAVVVLVGVAVVIIVFMHRRSTTPKTNKHDAMHGYQKSSPSTDEANVHNEISDMEAGTEGANSRIKSAVVSMSGDDSREYYCFTNPIKISEKGIKLADLSDFVLSSSQHHDKYTTEFKGFPEGMVKPHKAALENKDKNRYRNLYAYDETRVVLEVSNPKTETDYINANYVHGFNSPRAYIASQGTTKDNLDDFWRMIWQTNSGKIVMLTNVWEECRVKCLEYWPVEEDTKMYGSITVTLANTEVFSNFTIRTMFVKKENERERNVQQFHFTAWPDRGVPTYCSALVHFRSKVKHAPTTCKGPTIVHCSAGIGRTGTYIALDFLTDQGRELGMVDVAGCVETLRRQRVNMVQTEDQYVFIHQALVETLMLSTSALPTEKFPETYRDLLTVDPNKGEQKLDLEFQMIGNMSPAPEGKQYSTAKEVKHREKNRYSNILPLDDYMPSIYEPGLATNGGYINAAFLPSYKDSNGLIITQSPLETTKEDFWKMVFHQQVHTIVMMNSRAELKDNEVYWPPTDEKVTLGDIEVTGKRSEKKVGHTVLTLTLKFSVMERTIRLLQFGHWQSGAQVPEEPKHILTALELVRDWQRRTGNHTVVVHCMDGTERSGLFCVLYALLERTKIEHDVAIAQVIQDMRNRREQIVPNLAQFKFCHEVVLEFLRQFDTYSNFSSI